MGAEDRLLELKARKPDEIKRLLSILEKLYKRYRELHSMYIERRVGTEWVEKGREWRVRYEIRPYMLRVWLGAKPLFSDIDHDGVWEWIRALRWALGEEVGPWDERV